MVGGLNFLVKEIKGLYYPFSETKVLNSGGVTVELICVLISHMQMVLTIFCLFIFIYYFLCYYFL